MRIAAVPHSARTQGRLQALLASLSRYLTQKRAGRLFSCRTVEVSRVPVTVASNCNSVSGSGDIVADQGLQQALKGRLI